MSSLSRLRRVAVESGRDLVRADFSSVAWLDPLHLVLVASAAHTAVRTNRRFDLVGLSDDQAGYAARMHLGAVLDELGIPNSLRARGREWDRRDTLHPLSAVRGEADARVAAELVADRVRPADPDAAHALYVGISEIGANTVAHSRVDMGFVAVQVIEARASLRFAVADGGVGLRRTLEPRGARSDCAAIGLALDGISESAQADAGTGVRRTTEALINVNGDSILVSGGGAASVSVDGRDIRSAPQPFEGTLFEGRIPLAQGRHAQGDSTSLSERRASVPVHDRTMQE